MVTDKERIEIRRKIIDRFLPDANGMDRDRYIYGSHDEVLWYGLIKQEGRLHSPLEVVVQ
jgi:hypothetical protein